MTTGRYEVDKYLRVIGENNVFAVGSCSSANPGMIRPAMEQAKIVAQNIVRTINGKPLIAYKKKFSYCINEIIFHHH